MKRKIKCYLHYFYVMLYTGKLVTILLYTIHLLVRMIGPPANQCVRWRWCVVVRVRCISDTVHCAGEMTVFV